MLEVSQHDLERDMDHLKHLRELAARLNFREDVVYWDAVIKQKTENEEGNHA